MTANSVNSNNKKNDVASKLAAKNNTFSKRFVRLTKSLQFYWFLGHAITLFASFIYFFTFSFKQSWYRIAFFGALQSFGVLIYQQQFLSKSTTSKPAASEEVQILEYENILYFILALTWISTPKLSIALVPYIAFSTLHFSSYLQSTLLPKLFPGATADKVSSYISKFHECYNEKSMYWVASGELLIECILILRALLFFPKSWIVLIIYSLFLKVKFELSKYSTTVFAQWRVIFDGIISHPMVPPQIKKAYNFIKLNLISLSNFKLIRYLNIPIPIQDEKKKEN
ncbi:nucleoporin POM33 NDAI_0D03000 [Naumovozyma dairenensis CBS 421]|uniref:Pore membrane protein of 33 kDa n=1 Tax=Naumovozyma dairenensis (strain ATCC 10597 / BCRC 20456 / CBS 421 / NBRC 0211 / NRRL Y-12639) TaxID=1071378 RepID=G0WA03_NAUDC|nr:hypothetical protein NDAI_0D03000 [Naumovozyma dairenensis CBS 421]CCD24614.1 hypothetical protein NDAI_0D03000 [Naumovozyma dairenensis CBS 421]